MCRWVDEAASAKTWYWHVARACRHSESFQKGGVFRQFRPTLDTAWGLYAEWHHNWLLYRWVCSKLQWSMWNQRTGGSPQLLGRCERHFDNFDSWYSYYIHDISCFIILNPSASSAHIKIRSVHPVDQQCVPLFQHKGRAHRTAGRSAGGTGSTHDTPGQF